MWLPRLRTTRWGLPIGLTVLGALLLAVWIWKTKPTAIGREGEPAEAARPRSTGEAAARETDPNRILASRIVADLASSKGEFYAVPTRADGYYQKSAGTASVRISEVSGAYLLAYKVTAHAGVPERDEGADHASHEVSTTALLAIELDRGRWALAWVYKGEAHWEVNYAYAPHGPNGVDGARLYERRPTESDILSFTRDIRWTGIYYRYHLSRYDVYTRTWADVLGVNPPSEILNLPVTPDPPAPK